MKKRKQCIAASTSWWNLRIVNVRNRKIGQLMVTNGCCKFYMSGALLRSGSCLKSYLLTVLYMITNEQIDIEI
jgi:hypothetical protein